MFGGCFVYLSLYAVNQAQVAKLTYSQKNTYVYNSIHLVQVQRLLTLPSLQKAQAALWLQVDVPTKTMWSQSYRLPLLQVPILIVLSLATSLAGLCIFHRFRDCDPIAAGLQISLSKV